MNSEIKDIVNDFMENKPAFEYLEKHILETYQTNKNKTQCNYILLHDNTLLCIRAHKNRYNIATENVIIYFQKGNFVTDENGKNDIEYITNEYIDIPENFYIIGESLDCFKNVLESYKVFPIFDKKYMISKDIADQFTLMYEDKSIYTILYEDKISYKQGPNSQEFPSRFHYN